MEECVTCQKNACIAMDCTLSKGRIFFFIRLGGGGGNVAKGPSITLFALETTKDNVTFYKDHVTGLFAAMR